MVASRRFPPSITHLHRLSRSRCTFKVQLNANRTISVHEQEKGHLMDKSNFFDSMQARLNKVLENTPAKDLEKNVRAALTQGFSRLDLVTREEFDIQAQVLAKTRAKLEALESRVAELEALINKPQ